MALAILAWVPGCGPSGVGSITLPKPADKGAVASAGGQPPVGKAASRKAKGRVVDESQLPGQQALPQPARRKG
jgi:hypothetical protein